MGPGCFHPRNSCGSTLGATGVGASMGPGCFHPRNSVPLSPQAQVNVLLQWGRDVSIPEMAAKSISAARAARLQWGRDVSIPEMRAQTDGVRRWMQLQWGRDVSIPEIRNVRRWLKRIACFNGAGMFPSQKSCVDDGEGGEICTLQWGRDVSIPQMDAQLPPGVIGASFNGAGMFPSQKLGGPPVARRPAAWLQWGRDVSIPEIRVARPGLRYAPCFNGAGMFPSQKCVVASASAIPSVGFNGAGMFPSQKFYVARQVWAPQEASMGPGCFHPRNCNICTAFNVCLLLQWGRDVSIPEISLALWGPCCSICFNGAGMFPSQKSRHPPGSGRFYPSFNGAGMFPSQKCQREYWRTCARRCFNGAGMFPSQKSAIGRLITGTSPASMGPGCFHPRNPAASASPAAPSALQWGRDVSIPEMFPKRMARRPLASCFNGAGMFPSQK